MLTKSKPEEAKRLFAEAQTDADRRWKLYQFMAGRDLKAADTTTTTTATTKPATTADQQP